MEAEILKKAMENSSRATAKNWNHEETQISRVAASKVNTVLM
ncbi:MAG: hypothetical protein ACJAUR_000101 [Ulvibacter sp.]|jgi:hypothetical protein